MPRKLPEYPSFEEYLSYLEGLGKAKADKRYILATVLAYEAGLRLSEIVGYKDIVPPLNQDMVDLNGHTIKIISGKGQKDRVVPLPKKITEKAVKLLPIKLSRRSIQWFTTKHTKRILGKMMSFHKFRHGFASRLANQNVPLHQIQMWMGHSNISTTGIYMHASPSEEAINKVRELF